MERVGLFLVFAGLAGIFIGRPIANDFWATELTAAGYTECAGRGFALTGQLFREVWVREPAACADERFATMMRDPRFSREEIVRHMESLGSREFE